MLSAHLDFMCRKINKKERMLHSTLVAETSLKVRISLHRVVKAHFHYKHEIFCLFYELILCFINFFALLSACLKFMCRRINKKKQRMLYSMPVVETSPKIKVSTKQSKKQNKQKIFHSMLVIKTSLFCFFFMICISNHPICL